MTETRPANCRFRLQEEGKPYPRSSCQGCGLHVSRGLGSSCSWGSKTTDPDTSPEAVERLAKDHDEVGNSPEKYVMGHPHHWKTAATLRALSAERDALKAGLAEAVRLVRILQKAAHNDRYIGQDYPVKAVDTFLARHQKETDT